MALSKRIGTKPKIKGPCMACGSSVGIHKAGRPQPIGTLSSGNSFLSNIVTRRNT